VPHKLFFINANCGSVEDNRFETVQNPAVPLESPSPKKIPVDHFMVLIFDQRPAGLVTSITVIMNGYTTCGSRWVPANARPSLH
jgi:hypothetical protein